MDTDPKTAYARAAFGAPWHLLRLFAFRGLETACGRPITNWTKGRPAPWENLCRNCAASAERDPAGIVAAKRLLDAESARVRAAVEASLGGSARPTRSKSR